MSNESANLNEKLDRLESQASKINKLVIFIPVISTFITLFVGFYLNSRLEEQKGFSNKIDITHKMLVAVTGDRKLVLATDKLLKKLFEEDQQFYDELSGALYTFMISDIKDSIQSDDPGSNKNVDDIRNFAKNLDGPLSKKFTESVDKIKSSHEEALSLERKGFQLLVNNKIKEAQIKFEECEKIFNGFHNANEIAKLLSRYNEPIDKEKRKEIYEDIVNKYSWKAPKREIEIMKEFIKSNPLQP